MCVESSKWDLDVGGFIGMGCFPCSVGLQLFVIVIPPTRTTASCSLHEFPLQHSFIDQKRNDFSLCIILTDRQASERKGALDGGFFCLQFYSCIVRNPKKHPVLGYEISQAP